MHSEYKPDGRACDHGPFLLFEFFVFQCLFFVSTSAWGLSFASDSGRYERRIRFDAADHSRVWDTALKFANDLKYPERMENQPESDKLNGQIHANFGFYLYQQTAFLKQVDGVITAEVDIQVKDDFILAAIHDIYFIDYARDRYGKFSPKTSRKFALPELKEKKKNNKIWQEHFITIDENLNQLLNELQKSLDDILNSSSG